MDTRLIVKTNDQVAELWQANQLIKSYVISTARKGEGFHPGSLCTPLGKLRIARKIGENQPLGRVFRDRIPTQELWDANPANPLFATREDLVLTRILWLEGLEERNRNTFERFIYLLGTNREGLLGTKDSGGGIRFANKDIIEVFNLMPLGSEVEVI